jgi:hypothetical protein
MSEESVEALDIKITGKPESVQLAQYYLILGAFIQAWTTLEYIFDLCIATIYHHAPGGKFCGRKQPRELSKKLKYFRTAHRKIHQLEKLAETAEHIATVIESVGGVRHRVMHSVQVRAGSTYKIDARKAIPHGSKYMEERATIDPKDIAKLAAKIAGALQPMADYARVLIETFPPPEK